MAEKLKLEKAIQIIKEMGHIIRHLDEDGQYNEYWTQDGDYNLYLLDNYGVD